MITSFIERLSFAEILKPQYGLRHILHVFIFLYLLVAACIIALSLPANTLLTDNQVIDTIASVVLVGSLCLHLASAMRRDCYTNLDAFLDAGILAVFYLTVQSPVLGNATFYLLIGVVSCVITTRRVAPFVLLMIAANLLAIVGLYYMTSPVLTEYGDQLRLQSWHFFVLNLAGFPALSYFINTLIEMHRKRQEDLEAIRVAQQQLEASRNRLQLSEKMASLGLAIGSVTHEMNNNLGALQNTLEMLDQEVMDARQVIERRELTRPEQENLLEQLGRWVHLGRQVAAHSGVLLRSIKAQTRYLVHSTVEEFSVTQCIRDVCQLLQHECRLCGCQLIVSIGDEQATLVGEPGRFSQLLMNLIKNAIDAYPDLSSAGERPIIVSLYPEADALVLEVTDQGCGIESQHLPRIFEHLFTTKPSGKGTGMGLSIVREIVEQDFNGQIDVRSHEGEGTSFTLFFPHRSSTEKRELELV